ncbi:MULTISPECIES: YceI family protein [Olivibacter]|uniref:YceI family protein n=2 Tax=Sphingobacteriaceae TaxID=84566 RepID=F4C7Z8_SPHS2|nr:YceI family protein [Olivibacter sp. UJ_SKK_5.1]MDX3916835.1 YceI family protein [Pseudosphingobacterium sp.]
MASIWKVDPAHSEVQFKVKHLVISTVAGNFNKFDGQIEATNEDFSDATIRFMIDADSIDTNMKDRDEHLRSADFFDTANYPELTFQSSSFEKKGGREYLLRGDLTIKGHTQAVQFEVEFGGTAKDSYGNQKAGFEATAKISRQVFGLKWNDLTEAGSVVVGDEVKIVLNLQFIKQS